VDCCVRSGQAYEVGPVFGPWSSGLTANSSASRRDFSPSTSRGEKMTTLLGVWSSIIVGVNSGRWSPMMLGIVSLQDRRSWQVPFTSLRIVSNYLCAIINRAPSLRRNVQRSRSVMLDQTHCYRREALREIGLGSLSISVAPETERNNMVRRGSDR
jgi:hypothetical protein